MCWVDNDDYLGPDRRLHRRFRLLERRSTDLAQSPPSLGLLLRKLQVWASGVVPGDDAGIERFCARLEVVSSLAIERGHTPIAARLDALARDLRAQPACNVQELSARQVRMALALLNDEETYAE